MVGRKSKLTRELLKEIEKAIHAGLSNKEVCSFVGISEKTFYRWMQKSQFCQQIGHFRALLQIRLLQKLFDEGKKNWKVYAWFLERRFPEEFGRNRQISKDDFI